MQTLRVNNSRIVTIKNGKFSGYYFYMNLNVGRDFQICISVTLIISFDRQEKIGYPRGQTCEDLFIYCFVKILLFIYKIPLRITG